MAASHSKSAAPPPRVPFSNTNMKVVSVRDELLNMSSVRNTCRYFICFEYISYILRKYPCRIFRPILYFCNVLTDYRPTITWNISTRRWCHNSIVFEYVTVVCTVSSSHTNNLVLHLRHRFSRQPCAISAEYIPQFVRTHIYIGRNKSSPSLLQI